MWIANHELGVMLNSNEMVSQKLGDIVCEEKMSGARKSVGW